MQKLISYFKNNLKWYLKSVSKSNSSILNQLKDYNPNNDLADVMNSGSSKNIFIFPPAMLKVAYLPLYKKLFSDLDYKCHVLHLLNDKDIVERYAEYIMSQNCEELVFIGYSGGANIAYDTALFLEKNFNIKVKTIIMIDGFKWEDGLDFVVVNEKNIDEMLEEFLKQNHLTRYDLGEKLEKMLLRERSNFLNEAQVYQQYCQNNKNKTAVLSETKIYNIESEDHYVDPSKDTRHRWDDVSASEVTYIKGVGSHLSMLNDEEMLTINRNHLLDILKECYSNKKDLIIKAGNLIKEYGNSSTKFRALNNVSLDIYAGEFLVVLGTSGSGKSTLLNSLSTLEEFDAGKLWYYGESVNHSDKKQILKIRKDYIGFVFQQYHLIPNLNVTDNIATGSYLAKDSLDMWKILKELSLDDKLDKYPNQLSGGEQQRVSIARALAKNSRIIFCDEPTGALDTKTGIAVLKILKELQKLYGITIILVTHNNQIASIADRVLHMRDGAITKVDNHSAPLKVEEVDWL